MKQRLVLILGLVMIAPALRAICAPPMVHEDDGVTSQSMAAAARGLDYLAKQQQADGSFDSPDGGGPRIEVTADVLLAFLASGAAPDEGRYGLVIHDAISYLAQQAPADGYFGGADASRIPGQASALLALSRAYAVESTAQRQETRAAIANAVAFLLANRDPKKQSAWGADPASNQPDLFVTARVALALRSAHEEGFAMPDEALRRVGAFALSCARAEPQKGVTSFAMQGQSASVLSTASGLVCLSLSGLTDRSEFKQGARALASSAPATARTLPISAGAMVAVAARDAREPGAATFKALRDQLLPRQGPDGAWPAPSSPNMNAGSPTTFDPPGRVFATAWAVAVLTTPYGLEP